MIKKTLLSIVLPILGMLTSGPLVGYQPESERLAKAKAPKTLMGTIKFPKTLTTVPLFRIYHEGYIVNGSADNVHKVVAFSIPRRNEKFQFDILITESVYGSVHSDDDADNTVTYLRIADNKPNKLYHVTLLPKYQHDTKQNQLSIVHQWRIIEDKIIRDDGRIPDEAIIICCDPSWVELISVNSECELPIINIKPEALTRCGSQEKFHEKSTKILLAAIDSDTVHADAQATDIMKHENNRIIIPAPTFG